MQSLIKSKPILIRHHKCVSKELRRWMRFRSLVIDKPPDYYPTIEQKLNQINYHENATNLVDIGFSKNSDVRQTWYKIKKNVETELKAQEEKEVDEEEDQSQLDYKKVYSNWLLSDEGIQSTVDVANHYAIFRDLFPPKPQITSASAIETIPPKPIYFFSPLVPIKAEFCANESEIEKFDVTIDKLIKEDKGESSGDIIVSQAFRGNILFPRNCLNPPNITIDSSAINGISQKKKVDSIDEMSGRIRLIGDESNYYTICLINLDSHFGDESNVCHWMTANIHNKDNVTNYETVVKYLPVYGVKGLGYHRFVFLLYKHKSLLKLEQINDFDLEKRKFNAFDFMSSHGSDNTLIPIGLSWFQTTWDYSSQKVFYDYLDMRSPYYEWVAPDENAHLFKQLQFPARAPFNIYLDRFRDPKDIAKDVLCERLKSINPYNYDNVFDKPRVSPQIHKFAEGTPDWLKASIRKRRSRVGVYRGLRPHSAIEPLDNNADLDRPTWPRIHESVSPLNQPIPYPDGHRRPKPLRETLWVKPPHEHPTYRIQFEEKLDDEDKKQIRKSD